MRIKNQKNRNACLPVRISRNFLLSLAVVVMALFNVTNVLADVYIGSGGDGSETNPYLVSTADDLMEWSASSLQAGGNNTYSGMYFSLTADIDLAGVEWTRIKNFQGHFYGNGHAIKNLTINKPDQNYDGLFYSLAGNVDCLQLLNVDITGKEIAGALAGSMTAGTVSNVFAAGKVTGNNNLGGLVGSMYGGEIINSYALVDVTGVASNTAGLVGGQNGGTIHYCYAGGTVICTPANGGNVGGVVGSQWGDASTLQYCVAVNPKIQGPGDWGTGKVRGTKTGGNPVFSNCYGLKEMEYNSQYGKGTEKTLAELKMDTTYAALGWDISTSSDLTKVWYIRNGESFPTLQWQESTVLTPVATSMTIRPGNAVLLLDQPQQLKILSMNNSLIDYNNQNTMFDQLAASAGKSTSWTKHTNLGRDLQLHYDETSHETGKTAKQTVASQAWTHIILQEQTIKPRTEPSNFMSSVRQWVTYIRENCPNPHVKIIITVNWPLSTTTDFDGDVNALLASYKRAEQEFGVGIAPVGCAYKLIRDADEANFTALYSDDRHPTLQASYLSACTLFALLFNESPVGITYKSSLSQEKATAMQTRAWEAYQAYEQVIDDFAGTVKYSATVYDQFNQPMVIDNNAFSWTVNGGGGTISDALFTGNGETGVFTIGADFTEQPTISAEATLKVVKPVPASIGAPAVDQAAQVVKVQYYTLNGVELKKPGKGLFIEKTTYRNNLVKARKHIVLND
jgi:hypothetical protein